MTTRPTKSNVLVESFLDALRRIEAHVAPWYQEELRVESRGLDDIFGSLEWCRLVRVIPSSKLVGWRWWISFLFPGDWLDPLVTVQLPKSPRYISLVTAYYFDKRIKAIAQTELEKAMEISGVEAMILRKR